MAFRDVFRADDATAMMVQKKFQLVERGLLGPTLHKHVLLLRGRLVVVADVALHAGGGSRRRLSNTMIERLPSRRARQDETRR